MSLLLYNVHMGAMMKQVKMEMGRMGVRFMKEGREPVLLYASDLGLCSESEEKLSAMVVHFVEVYRKRSQCR